MHTSFKISTCSYLLTAVLSQMNTVCSVLTLLICIKMRQIHSFLLLLKQGSGSPAVDEKNGCDCLLRSRAF